jgi:hypothetical protein
VNQPPPARGPRRLRCVGDPERVHDPPGFARHPYRDLRVCRDLRAETAGRAVRAARLPVRPAVRRARSGRRAPRSPSVFFSRVRSSPGTPGVVIAWGASIFSSRRGSISPRSRARSATLRPLFTASFAISAVLRIRWVAERRRERRARSTTRARVIRPADADDAALAKDVHRARQDRRRVMPFHAITGIMTFSSTGRPRTRPRWSRRIRAPGSRPG